MSATPVSTERDPDAAPGVGRPVARHVERGDLGVDRRGVRRSCRLADRRGGIERPARRPQRRVGRDAQRRIRLERGERGRSDARGDGVDQRQRQLDGPTDRHDRVGRRGHAGGLDDDGRVGPGDGGVGGGRDGQAHGQE